MFWGKGTNKSPRFSENDTNRVFKTIITKNVIVLVLIGVTSVTHDMRNGASTDLNSPLLVISLSRNATLLGA